MEKTVSAFIVILATFSLYAQTQRQTTENISIGMHDGLPDY